MEFVIVTVLLALLMLPLVAIYRRKVTEKKAKFTLLANIASFFAFCILTTVYGIAGHAFAAEPAAATAAAGSSAGLAYLGAGLAVGLACIGAGIAVANAASAAIGAISENEKLLGKSLIFVALAEGVAIYGLIIAIMILSRV